MPNLVITRNPLASGFLGVVTIATTTQVQIVAGSVTQNYFGVGFTYNQFAEVVAGTVTSSELFDAANGGLQYRISGLNHSAVTTYQLVSSGSDVAPFFLNGNDTISGSAEPNLLLGYTGVDHISGAAGNDILIGAGDAVADTLSGGTGDDSYYIDGSVGTATDAIVEMANGGIDLVYSYGSYTLPAEVENLQLLGTLNSAATGNALANEIIGNAQNNVLDGGAGDDRMVASAGDDSIDGGSGFDTAVYSGHRSDYSINWTGSNFTIADHRGNEGTDTLLRVERLEFSGVTQALQVAATLLVFSWKSHTLLNGVSIGGGATVANTPAITSTEGAASFPVAAGTNATLGVTRPVPDTETGLSAAAVNLQDAIAILKLIVGLNVNGSNAALSPYQALAADFNSDGTVGLTDAIDVLKHVVGLPAPLPQWIFFEQLDAGMAGRANLSPGLVSSAISVAVGADDVNIGLVGVLRGDVDGSFSGTVDSVDLDTTQPGYFTNLLAEHGIPLAQFGVYPV